MPYKATGRPAGRPRKDGSDPQPRPKPEPEPSGPGPADKPGPFWICRECYPDGWPEGATGLSCQHGIWSRPWGSPK